MSGVSLAQRHAEIERVLNVISEARRAGDIDRLADFSMYLSQLRVRQRRALAEEGAAPEPFLNEGGRRQQALAGRQVGGTRHAVGVLADAFRVGKQFLTALFGQFGHEADEKPLNRQLVRREGGSGVADGQHEIRSGVVMRDGVDAESGAAGRPSPAKRGAAS